MDLGAAGAPLADVLTGFARDPFTPGDALLAGRFIRVDEHHATLVLKLHHIITDWWSFNILHTDFSEGYLAVSSGLRPRPGARRSSTRTSRPGNVSWSRRACSAAIR